MIPQNTIKGFLFVLLLVVVYPYTIPDASADTAPPPLVGEAEASYHSDRFIFRGSDVDNFLLIILTFGRGSKEISLWGEFFGAVFYKNEWSFLEGNDKYFYRGKDLEKIQPSYFAKAEGSPVSGFRLQYDGGDFTINISSGPTTPLYVSDKGANLKRSIGFSEAVVTLKGIEYWGELLHEPLIWKGFDGLKRYKGLYKEYQGFYLTTVKGRQIYFHQNKADRGQFLKEYNFSETLQNEGGVILSGNEVTHEFTSPIPLTTLKDVTPPFALYSVPQRWRIEVPSFGTFFVWSRLEIGKRWIFGGYHLMAVEGIIKSGSEEERIWGFAEYFH
ncbi:MAG: hypothetical protein ABGX83_01335 [Nitrospira sp.]|nr:hypothetical protein [Candidatus Manganitrophaceae bacterium]HIL35569.1 hypothetical protein [Candidatus Manganitrophaceae bacterium]